MSQFTTSQVAPIPSNTKGDLVAHDGTSPIRLPVGTNGQILKADSTQTSGLIWADATASDSDHQSAYDEIISGLSVTVSQYKQMVIFGRLIVDGELNIEGSIFSEP